METKRKKRSSKKVKLPPKCSCTCPRCDIGAHCGNWAKGCEWLTWGELVMGKQN